MTMLHQQIHDTEHVIYIGIDVRRLEAYQIWWMLSIALL